MAHLRYNNINCYVNGVPEEIAAISHLLSYSVKGARYSAAYQTGKWDGKKTFYSSRYDMFPTGLLHYVLTNLKGQVHFTLEDRRPDPPIFHKEKIFLTDKKGSELKLRPYQEEAVHSIWHNERGIVKLATGSGKTLIGIAATQMFNMPTLFIVHRKELMRQTQREYLEKARIKTGLIGDGVYDPQYTTVAMIQSIHSLMKSDPDRIKDFMLGINFGIWDEVHRASDTYQSANRLLKNAYYQLGLSATALISSKENKLQSMALTGPIIYEVKMKTLVDQKHIAKPYVYFINSPDSEEIYGEWDDIYQEGIVNNEERNLVICLSAMKMLRKGRNSLILIEKLEHGKNLFEMLKEKANILYVSGKNTTEQRKEALTKLQTGQVDMVIASRIFNEGIDIPRLECVIVASGWKSPILSYQRYGRGTRKTDIKEDTIIIDFFDRNNNLLHRHSQERYSLCLKDKAFDVKRINLEDLDDEIDSRNS